MFLNKFLRKSQEELEAANQLSLQEINNTVEIPKEGSFFKKVLLFFKNLSIAFLTTFVSLSNLFQFPI